MKFIFFRIISFELYAERFARIVLREKFIQPIKHTLSVLVEDEVGVLSRISGLFARRSFNIDSLGAICFSRKRLFKLESKFNY